MNSFKGDMGPGGNALQCLGTCCLTPFPCLGSVQRAARVLLSTCPGRRLVLFMGPAISPGRAVGWHSGTEGPWCVCSWGPAPARELHKHICSVRPGETTEEWGPATTGPVGWTAGSSGGAEPRAARLPVTQGLRWARQGLLAAEAHGAVASPWSGGGQVSVCPQPSLLFVVPSFCVGVSTAMASTAHRCTRR